MSLESLEFWKTVFEITGVVLLLLTFIAGSGVLWFSKRVNAVQAGQLRQFDRGLTDAKTELGKQQERAANADARVAGLEQDIVIAKLGLVKQQERAIKAERSLLELQESISWRTPDRALIPQLAPPLQVFSGQRFAFVSDFSDPERNNVLSWIGLLLGTAKWRLEAVPPSPTSELTFQATNIVLWVSPAAPNVVTEAARALVPVLEHGGLPNVVLQSGWGPKPDAAPPDLIRVVIFRKGPRMTVTGNMITFEGSPSRLFIGDGPPH